MWGGRNINSPLHQISEIDISHQFEFVKTCFNFCHVWDAMNSCELILNIVIPLFIFLCFDPSISAWSSVGAFSFAVFMLLDEQSIVRAREEVHASQLLLLLPSSEHHCVIEWTFKTYSTSRHFAMIFSYFVNSGEIGGPQTLSTALLGGELIESLLRCLLDSLLSASFRLYRDSQ